MGYLCNFQVFKGSTFRKYGLLLIAAFEFGAYKHDLIFTVFQDFYFLQSPIQFKYLETP